MSWHCPPCSSPLRFTGLQTAGGRGGGQPQPRQGSSCACPRILPYCSLGPPRPVEQPWCQVSSGRPRPPGSTVQQHTAVQQQTVQRTPHSSTPHSTAEQNAHHSTPHIRTAWGHNKAQGRGGGGSAGIGQLRWEVSSSHVPSTHTHTTQRPRIIHPPTPHTPHHRADSYHPLTHPTPTPQHAPALLRS